MKFLTFKMKLFCNNSKQLLVVNYFYVKSFIIDIWQCPKYASVSNTSIENYENGRAYQWTRKVSFTENFANVLN